MRSKSAIKGAASLEILQLMQNRLTGLLGVEPASYQDFGKKGIGDMPHLCIRENPRSARVGDSSWEEGVFFATEAELLRTTSGETSASRGINLVMLRPKLRVALVSIVAPQTSDDNKTVQGEILARFLRRIIRTI